jgi:hypothetical protein
MSTCDRYDNSAMLMGRSRLSVTVTYGFPTANCMDLSATVRGAILAPGHPCASLHCLGHGFTECRALGDGL